jgi:multidrug efflux system outer membrane protein
VVRGYFTLRALDRRLEFLELTRDGWQKATELMKLRLDGGLSNELEYRQVESNLRLAIARVPVARQQRAAQEGLLAVLLGRSPREVFAAEVARGNPATPERGRGAGRAAIRPAAAPARPARGRGAASRGQRAHRCGARALLPHDHAHRLLRRREHRPRRPLQGRLPAPWGVAGNLLQPLFAGGQIRGGVEFADAQTKEAAELYQKAIQNAFREVRDSLLAQTNLREAHLAQIEHERALARTAELARLRYDNGAVGLLDLLEAERQRVAATIEMIDAERDRRSAIVDLYLALGA